MKLPVNMSLLRSLLVPCLLLVAAFASACSHTGAYRPADSQSWRQVCPPPNEESNQLMFWDECEWRMETYSAQAACEAGDDVGCAVAAVLYSREDSPLYDLDAAVEMGEIGCERGHAASCVGQGNALNWGNRSEVRRSYVLFRRTCKEGMAPACYRLAALYKQFAENTNERKLATGLYKRSCDLNLPRGCRRFAEMYRDGHGVSKNKARSKKLYQKACKLGDDTACEELGKETEPSITGLMWRSDLNVAYVEWVDAFFVACKNGFRHACTYIGRDLSAGATSSPDQTWSYDRAHEAYRLGCRLGASESCYYLAWHVYAGRGSLSASVKEAAQLAQRACKLGYAPGCPRYQRYLSETLGQDEADAHAAKCSAGDNSSCVIAGRAYSHGENFSASGERARSLLLKACRRDDSEACERLAILYDAGELLDQDYKRAAHYFSAACKMGADYSCHALGNLYDEGQGVERDTKRALSSWTRACDLGWSRGCAAAGFHLLNVDEDERDDKRARAILELGCEYGSDWACANWAHMLESGRGGKANPGWALWRFKRECDDDFGAACFHAARMLMTKRGAPDGEPQPSEAAKYYELACKDGYAKGCLTLGSWYLKGEHLPVDPKKGASLYALGCEADDAKACARLGVLYRKGRGVERDLPKARGTFKKGCEKGGSKTWACALYAKALRGGLGGPKDVDKAFEVAKGACDGGNAASCSVAAHLVETDNVAVAQAEAERIFRKSCELGWPHWCRKVALMYRFGRNGLSKNIELAERYTARSVEIQRSVCRKRDNWGSCYAAAHSIAHDRGTDTDFPEARKFLEEACESGAKTACAIIAQERLGGEIFPRDVEKAVAGLTKSCKAGVDNACRRLAMHRLRGDGSPDATKSAQIYEKMCHPKKDKNACLSLGALYAGGDGVERQAGRALALLRTGCKEDDDDYFCSKALGSIFYLRPRELGEFNLYKDAKRRCANEDDPDLACSMQARALQHGFQVERDVDAAKELYEKVCENGDATACSRLRALQKVEEFAKDSQNEAADKSARAACKEGDRLGCLTAAVEVEFGSYDPARFAKAGDLYAKACALRDADACTLYAATGRDTSGLLTGKRYWNALVSSCDLGTALQCDDAGGKIDAFNWDLGIEQYKKACAKGLEDACSHLENNGYERPAPSRAATN